MKNWEEKIYAYSLDNAVNHEGKALENSVLAHLFQEGLEKQDIKKIMPSIKEVVKKVNNMNKEEQEKEYETCKNIIKKHDEKEKGLVELKNTDKKVVLRLAPFPSGALHIGNAKTYLLNALYAEKYKGDLLLVIDDTIGSSEKGISKDAYKLIPEAFDWLNVKYKKPIIYKSDRLEIYYEYAEKLIEKGKAYVCECSQEVLRKNRILGRECSCRQFSLKEQKKRWKLMFNGKPGEFTLRIKTGMQDRNPAFRDRVLFRISAANHPRVGKKYSVWPLLEFSWAIDDYLLGITHIIRGKDLMIESDMERLIWKIFNWKGPEIIHTGLVQLQGVEAKISKSKSQKEVASGKYTGWDDPRTWSVQSLKRRGILPESIKEFVKEIGLTQHDIIVPVDSLYAINRKLIDISSERYYFVESPIRLSIKNNPKIKQVEVKLHPEKDKTRKINLGKDIFISNGDYLKFKNKEVRLMHLFNVKLKSKNAGEFTDIENKDIQKIQWVSDFVNARILMPDGTFISGIAEKDVKKFTPGKVIQFERVGFARFDRINSAGEYEFWFTH